MKKSPGCSSQDDCSCGWLSRLDGVGHDPGDWFCPGVYFSCIYVFVCVCMCVFVYLCRLRPVALMLLSMFRQSRMERAQTMIDIHLGPFFNLWVSRNLIKHLIIPQIPQQAPHMTPKTLSSTSSDPKNLIKHVIWPEKSHQAPHITPKTSSTTS